MDRSLYDIIYDINYLTAEEYEVMKKLIDYYKNFKYTGYNSPFITQEHYRIILNKCKKYENRILKIRNKKLNELLNDN